MPLAEVSGEPKSGDQRVDLCGRTIQFSCQLVRFCQLLETSGFLGILSKQLLRAGTSIGANVHEAQGAQSKADFISKMSIAYKEALETLYWLKVIDQSNLAAASDISKWLDETSQLTRILSSVILTSKRNRQAARGI